MPCGSHRRVVASARSWRDLAKLRRGLETKLAPAAAKALPKLPRARALSTLKRAVKNLGGGGKGDRKWQKSKLAQVDAWLGRGAVTKPRRDFEMRVRRVPEHLSETFEVHLAGGWFPRRLGGVLNVVARAADLADADDEASAFLEDFLFAYGQVTKD